MIVRINRVNVSTFMSKLSPRQYEALEMLCSGKSYKQIGRELVIANQTLKTHMQRAREKTGCGSTVEMAVKFDREMREQE